MYTRLNIEERELISQLKAQGKENNEIARQLGRSPSTISREMQKYSVQGRYYAFLALDARRKEIKKEKMKKSWTKTQS